MPPQTTKSVLMGKLGQRITSAVKQHAHEETDYGFQRIPPGITGGIAQLTDMKFDVYKSGPNKDQPYFRATGVVVKPKSIIKDGFDLVVEGMQTSIMIPVCDTNNQDGSNPVTVEQHVADILNEMRKLGYVFPNNPDGNDLERAAATIKKVKPFFKFSTSLRAARIDPKTNKKLGEDGVWENWFGNKGLEDFKLDADGSDVDEGSGGDAGGEGEVGASSEGATDTTSSEGQSVEYNDQSDLDSLGERADGGDQVAAATLSQMWSEKGWSDEQLNHTDVPNWTAAVACLKGEVEPPNLEPAGPSAPEVGQHVKYKPMIQDPKDKKKFVESKKAVQCEITAVDSKTQRVDLTDLATKKAYKGVSWAKLEG